MLAAVILDLSLHAGPLLVVADARYCNGLRECLLRSPAAPARVPRACLGKCIRLLTPMILLALTCSLMLPTRPQLNALPSPSQALASHGPARSPPTQPQPATPPAPPTTQQTPLHPVSHVAMMAHGAHQLVASAPQVRHQSACCMVAGVCKRTCCFCMPGLCLLW